MKHKYAFNIHRSKVTIYLNRKLTIYKNILQKTKKYQKFMKGFQILLILSNNLPKYVYR